MASYAPMLATLASAPFSSDEWLFEPKLDGVRAVAQIEGGTAKLVSRRGNDMSPQYPSLARELAEQVRPMVLDGEIVALDERGQPSFQLLQQRLGLENPADIARADAEIPVVYYVFDVLQLDDRDLTQLPLVGRKKLLAEAVKRTTSVRIVEPLAESGEAGFRRLSAEGWEGVVAKRRESLYYPGRRSDEWLKIKGTTADEFVIGGYTEGLRARASTFGALLLGQYEDGRLVYSGHVGTGFDRETLHDLRRRLDAIRTEVCPFAEQPPLRVPATWVLPKLVAEVKFVQWTRDRRLRAPVFMRLRPDKPAREVRRATIAAAPTP